MTMPYPAYNGRPPPPNDFQMASYPPNGLFIPASVPSLNSTVKGPEDIRHISRTPSPTPSEAKAMKEGLITIKQLTNWRFYIRKEWTVYYILILITVVISTLVTIYHHQIVHWLTPATKWLHDLRFGWLVPIGILFVISFPPLFGHEIVAILCGLVWGLWIGFAIVCAGTFLGEVGNYYAFKYCCRARGEKMERTQIPYACLARCVREGGFKIALIARLSAIPGHFTTAIFATCGMNIFVFSLAAFFSLPKQFVTVYLGVLLEQSDTGTVSTKSTWISRGVIAVTILITVLAMWYIFRQMAILKPTVIYERRKARQAKLEQQGIYGNPALNDSDASVNGTNENIPLTAKMRQQEATGSTSASQYATQWQQQQGAYAYGSYQPDGAGHNHQQWDEQGRAIGYTPGPAPQVMYAPKPTHAGRAEIRPGAYAAPLATPVRAETSDEVPWELGGAQMRERSRTPQQYHSSPPPRQFQSPPRQYQSPPQQQYQPPPGLSQQPQQQQYQSPPQQYTSPPQQYQSPPPHKSDVTPTQAQFATYQPPLEGISTLPSAPLPTPPYAYQEPVSPFDDPPNARQEPWHSIEPTGASYHTAYGSETSLTENMHPPQAQAPPRQ